MQSVKQIANIALKSRTGPGATYHCCYSRCKSDSRYNNDNMFFFVPFAIPCMQFRSGRWKRAEKKHMKECETCRKADNWLRLCQPKFGCDIKLIKRYHYICSLHFVGESGPTANHPDPVRVPRTKKAGIKRRSLAEKYGHVIGVPMEQGTSTASLGNFVADMNEQLNMDQPIPVDAIGENTFTVKTIVEMGTQTKPQYMVDASTQTEDIEETCVKKPLVITKGTQTAYTIFPHMRRVFGYKQTIRNLKMKLRKVSATQTNSVATFEKEIQQNEKQCYFYTGLYFYRIMALLTFLGPAAKNLVYWNSKPSAMKRQKRRKLTKRQQLLIVLIRLRRGFTIQDMAYRFHILASHICNLTTTWVQFMFLEFSKIRAQMFPSRIQISQSLPAVFKRLKNIRVLVDCTEFFCGSPANFQQQGNLYSDYKAHTTFKVLVGCTPNGAISFVSDLYEGAMSDRELFHTCGIVDLLEQGDLVLADRGFTVGDLVESKGAHLNIPPFLKGRSHLTAQEEIETKNVAKERIYVEHVMGRLKSYRILKRILPLNMREIINQVVFVCACLVSLQPPIVEA